MSLAYTFSHSLENWMEFPPTPQKPSRTDEFFSSRAVYMLISSGVTENQPVYFNKNAK